MLNFGRLSNDLSSGWDLDRTPVPVHKYTSQLASLVVTSAL